MSGRPPVISRVDQHAPGGGPEQHVGEHVVVEVDAPRLAADPRDGVDQRTATGADATAVEGLGEAVDADLL